MSIVLTVEEVLEFIKAYPGCTPDHLTMGLSMDFYKYFVMLVVDHLVDAGIVQRNANGELFNVVRPVQRKRRSVLLMHDWSYPPALINYDLDRIELISTETPVGKGYFVRIFDLKVRVLRIGLGSGMSAITMPFPSQTSVLAIEENPPLGSFHWQRNSAPNIHLYLVVGPENRLVVATYIPKKQLGNLSLTIGFE